MKIYLSMVIPSSKGCNLKCWFCAIKGRGEADITNLSPRDYETFLKEISSSDQFEVERFSLQGYEPLLPNCWKQTHKLLKLADSFDIPGISIVSNGTYLGNRAKELSTCCDEIIVSLDSGIAAFHDKMRGVNGAFEKTLSGLYTAFKYFEDALIVNSLLIPKKRNYLESVPETIAKIGISHWYISPLADFSAGKYVENNISQLKEDIEFLSIIAKQHGVHCHLSDDVGHFDIPPINVSSISIAKPEEDVIVVRLSPDGMCAINKEVIYPSSYGHQWKGEKADQFIEKLLNI